LGPGATTGVVTHDGLRALRRVGQEHLARIVAWFARHKITIERILTDG
jgi:phosphohistidine phosphatase SixA